MRRGIDAGSLSNVVAFTGPFALYVASLAPGVAFWDTGEMQTVPNLLGIAHPTGFPAFVLGGWAFAHVVPFGDPAWRISLFSALAAAGAASVLAWFVRMLTGDALVATVAALVYAVGDVVWTRGARADVHDLALLFTALAFTQALRAARERSAQALAFAALACGCGLATHPVVAFDLPGVVIIAWPEVRRLRGAALARIAAAAVVPLAIYAYVPLRSAYVEHHGLDPQAALGLTGGAFWNYDAPSNLARFARYVSGASFHPGSAFREAASSGGVARSVALVHTVATGEFGLVLLALVFTGFVYLVACERRVAIAFAALFVAAAAFAPNYRPESDAVRYALGPLWAAGACAGVGAWWLVASLVGERSRAVSLLTAALLLAGAAPSVAPAARDVAHRRHFDDARRLGLDVAYRTADGSLVIASWTFAAPLAYDAYVAKSFGHRHLLSGWPSEFGGRLTGWRTRFKHVYYVFAATYYPGPNVALLFRNDRWQLAELRR